MTVLHRVRQSNFKNLVICIVTCTAKQARWLQMDWLIVTCMTNYRVVSPIALKGPGFTVLLAKQQAAVQNHRMEDLPHLIHVLLSA